jgi:hypothetical protein
MAYAKTSLRGEQRAVREHMRALGLCHRQIAVEFARRYRLRPRAAWRYAWGWSLKEAAQRISDFAARSGLDPDGTTVAMTAPHLSEYENWPGPGAKPAGRRPTPYLLSLLASVYECAVHDLLDLDDYEHMPPADRLIIDKTGPVDPEQERRATPRQAYGHQEPLDRALHAVVIGTRAGAERTVGVLPAALTPAASGPGTVFGTQPAVQELADIGSSYSGGACDGLGGRSPAFLGSAATTADALAAMTGLLGQRDHHESFRRALQTRWPEVCVSFPLPDYGVDWHLRLPGGRTLDGGGTIAVQVHPLKAARDGSAFLPVVGGLRFDQFNAVPHRGMLIGIDVQANGPARLFGTDLREAHRKIAQSSGIPSAVVVPRAYELDELAFGIIWALINFDDALLADDHALDHRLRELRTYEQLPYSSVGRQAAADLTSAARMWLGSSFCARHILRSLAIPADLPVFWTREQNGEEACAWLLFRHKYDYLRRISGQFAGTADSLVRGFCIPEATVAASARWERMLLFLSVALMESLGIHVKICVQPEYADVDGFVLLPGKRAVIATWIRADDIWHVDSVTRDSVLRGFGDVTDHVTAHSVSEAASPGRRLMVLADYLGLDWPRFWRRCADLGDHGCTGLVQPRSRLLSTNGVDAALRYVGMLGRDAVRQ